MLILRKINKEKVEEIHITHCPIYQIPNLQTELSWELTTKLKKNLFGNSHICHCFPFYKMKIFNRYSHACQLSPEQWNPNIVFEFLNIVNIENKIIKSDHNVVTNFIFYKPLLFKKLKPKKATNVCIHKKLYCSQDLKQYHMYSNFLPNFHLVFKIRNIWIIISYEIYFD